MRTSNEILSFKRTLKTYGVILYVDKHLCYANIKDYISYVWYLQVVKGNLNSINLLVTHGLGSNQLFSSQVLMASDND